MAVENPTLLRGFAWVVSRNPNYGLAPPYLDLTGFEPIWAIDGTEDGIRNPVWGDAYLLVTHTSELPRLERDWMAEPADLEQGFLVQTPCGEVRLTRLLDSRRTPWGIVQESEFEVVAPDRLVPRQSSSADGRAMTSEPGLERPTVPRAVHQHRRMGYG
jgi:hypothetical protein